MIKLCLMASLGNPPPLVFHQEQGVGRTIKEFSPLIRIQEGSRDLVQSSMCNLRSNEFEEPWEPISLISGANQLQNFDSTITKPLVIDMNDAWSDSVHFSFRIAEKCARHEKFVQLVTSGSSELENGGLDLSTLSKLLEVQPDIEPLFDLHQQEVASSLIYPGTRVDGKKPLMDFIGDMICNSNIIVSPDGRVLISGSGTEFKDILSIVAEFYMSKNSSNVSKQQMLVPYFHRPKSRIARAALSLSSLKLDAATVAPMKSPETAKVKSAKKKNSSKVSGEGDLYKRNLFHTCESLFSITMNQKQHGQMAILSIKKSGAELPQLLNQCSASIAGIGLAVFFSVVWKVACANAPFCSSKLFSTGLGIGLVWLSSAVNRLRDTVVYIIKNNGKLNSEEEMISKVDESMKQIYFRAATLMVVAVLKLA